MLKFLRSICKRGGGGLANKPRGADKTCDPVEYQGYRIQPAPRQVKNGWTTEAVITRETDGQLQTHHFIRADTAPDRNSAAALSITKSKTTIDQIGDRIFSEQSRDRLPSEDSTGPDGDSVGE